MTSALGGMFGGKDGSVEALQPYIGQRTFGRHTYGTPDRTVLIEALIRLDEHLRLNRDPRCLIPGLAKTCEELAHLWAGELGYDNDVVRGFLAATKGQQTIIQPTPRSDKKE